MCLELGSCDSMISSMKSLTLLFDYLNSDAGTVDDIMDDIQEEKDIADQISEAISRPGQQLFEDVIRIIVVCSVF